LASIARFRIKKKQTMINLERSLSDLQRRADELEREATELRRENAWLKDMVLMKGRRRRAGRHQALPAVEETPPNKGKSKGKEKAPEVEQEEEGDDYVSGSEEEGSEEEGSEEVDD
jgi:septal ring factor EnvC (AmiA/AmiB activator)